MCNKCDEMNELIILYISKTINELDSLKLFNHLIKCPDCRAELREVMKLATLLSNQMRQVPEDALDMDLLKSCKAQTISSAINELHSFVNETLLPVRKIVHFAFQYM